MAAKYLGENSFFVLILSQMLDKNLIITPTYILIRRTNIYSILSSLEHLLYMYALQQVLTNS